MIPMTFLLIPEDKITELCRRNRLRNAELFGSVLRQGLVLTAQPSDG